ncbi:MAG: TonB-dependent receptor, partial [Bacteroidia bacterium]
MTEKKNGEGLAGALISVDQKNAAVADVNGEFMVPLATGEHNVSAALTGYKSVSQTITIGANDTLRLTLVLGEGNNLLDEVVVSAGKFEQKLSDVTVSMEVIKSALIENKNTTSLDQIMNQVPGVTVSDGQASIRGGSGFAYGAGSRVLMMVDEMPMLSADAGDVKWNYLPLENLEQVEVIKGASSALFGSSALNGVINLRTAYARDKPVTSVQYYMGVYDAPRTQYKWWKGSSQQQHGFNFGHAQKIGNLDLVIGGHLFDDDGYRYLETEKRARFNTNLRYNFKKVPGLSIGVNTNYMDVQGGLFFLWAHADSAYIPQGHNLQKYDNIRSNVDPFITYYFGKGNKLSIRSRYFKTINKNDKNQEATAELFYNELQYQKHFARDFTVSMGYVFTKQQVYSDSLYGRHTGTNHAGYLQLDKKIKRLTLSLGLRGEYYKVDTAYTHGYVSNKIKDLPFQPVLRAGANYQLAKFTFLRASYGQGYRFPSIAEKYISTSVSVLKIYPNTALQPERGWSAEIGAKQGFKIGNFSGFLDVAGFWTEYNNMVEFVFDVYAPKDKLTGFAFIDAVNYAGFKCQNLTKAQIKGIEISVSGAGKIGQVGVSLFS